MRQSAFHKDTLANHHYCPVSEISPQRGNWDHLQRWERKMPAIITVFPFLFPPIVVSFSPLRNQRSHSSSTTNRRSPKFQEWQFRKEDLDGQARGGGREANERFVISPDWFSHTHTFPSRKKKARYLMERAEKRGISHAPLFSLFETEKSDGFMISFSKEAYFFFLGNPWQFFAQLVAQPLPPSFSLF